MAAAPIALPIVPAVKKDLVIQVAIFWLREVHRRRVMMLTAARSAVAWPKKYWR
jgi:hypothetical protein